MEHQTNSTNINTYVGADMQLVEREKGKEGEEGEEETLSLQGRGRVKGMPELEATGTHPGAHRPLQSNGAGRGGAGHL